MAVNETMTTKTETPDFVTAFHLIFLFMLTA
jgi:hypothetical protein